VRLAAAAWVMLLAGGCSSPDRPVVDDASSPVSCGFNCQEAGVVLPTAMGIKGLLQSCLSADGCHGAFAGHLPMPSGNELSSLVNTPSWEMPSLLRVKPGDPAASYLYRKLACDAGPIFNSCMPPGAPLSPSIVQAVHDWIEAGAPTQ
jgi:hypothetical protein